MCELIKKFSDLCVPRGVSKDVDMDDADDDSTATNQTILYSSSDYVDNNSTATNAHNDSAVSEEKGERIEINFSLNIVIKWKIAER